MATSSLIECYLFYKNLGDLTDDKTLPFHKKIINRVKLSYNIVQKKETIDPIQDVVITENVLAVIGITMPIFTSFLCLTTGMDFFDFLGGMVNGAIQLRLAWLILKENTEKLTGRGVNKSDREKIIKLLSNQAEVSEIQDFKNEYIGANAMKISALVKININEINRKILIHLDQKIAKITPDVKKQKEIKDIVTNSNTILLTNITEVISDMETDVKSKYPSIVDIDIELSKSNIAKEYEGIIPITPIDNDHI